MSKKTKRSSEMKILTKIYQQNLDCRTESTEIFEHGTYSSDSIKNKIIKTMKGRFYFTIGHIIIKKKNRISK